MDARVAKGAKYIKVVADMPLQLSNVVPGMGGSMGGTVLADMVSYAHSKGLLVAVHDTSLDGLTIAVDAEANLQTLRANGVPILVGTDSNTGTPNPIGGYGGAVHEELKLLAAAGVPTLEILQGATTGVAAAYGLATGTGTLTTGHPPIPLVPLLLTTLLLPPLRLHQQVPYRALLTPPYQ